MIRDRVKELRRVKAKDLLPHDRNWRRHPDYQRTALQGVLEEVGFADALIARETLEGLQLIDGHLRRDANPDIEVPVLVVDLDEQEAEKLLVTLDPLSAMARADQDALLALLKDTQFENQGVNDMLEALANNSYQALEPMPDKTKPGLTDPDDVPPEPEEPYVKLGDIWQCGEHRVMCGDTSQRQITYALMDGQTAAMGLTSPPYAVGKEYEEFIPFEQHIALLEAIADQGLTVIEPGGFFFVNFGEIAAQSHASKLTGSKRQCLYPISKDYWRIFHEERQYELYAQRVWYKPFNRLQQPFWTYHTSIPHHQEWEHIWTWRLPGGDGDQVYDWDISVHAIWDTRNEATDDKPLTRHVAAFPVGIPERAIKAHSQSRAIIWEPFLGSGTTLIACERLGRICYGMDIEPRYVQVAVERWQNYTGQKAELVSGS